MLYTRIPLPVSIMLLYVLYSGPNRGHYITIVKSYGYWILFDDDIIEVCNKTDIMWFDKV